jgi:ketosteroid isomerase-like protein
VPGTFSETWRRRRRKELEEVAAMRTLPMLLSAAALLVVLGCGQGPDLEQRRQEILSLHERFIQAHLDKDAATLAKPTADDYISVSRGGVQPMSASDVEAMLAPYLAETEFSHYEDIAEPILGISDDGSTAWSIVQVRVAGTRSPADGEPRTFDTAWAWLTLYRRDGQNWQRIVDVSTNRPFDQEL